MAENVGGIFYSVTADTSALIGQSRVVDRETQSMAASFNKITQAIKLYAAAMALVKSAQMADDMRLLAARVQVAAGSLEAGAAAMGELQRIAARTQTELATTAGVFNRLNSSIVAMGGNQNDTLRITELLGKAIKVSGASGAEASSAMTQFGQALGSGKLAGDELRSLLENAPYLMQQLAAGIGVPVGALKQLGEEGKLTADVVTNALGKAAGKIDEDFKRLPQTFDAAMVGLSDAAKRANEALDTLTGSSAALTGVTRGVTSAMDALADQLLSVITEGDKLGKNKAVEQWAQSTTMVLSYVIDAADLTVQTLSVIGRNASFMAQGIGREIGGIVAQFNALGEGGGIFTQSGRDAWRAVGEAMREDAKAARTALDAADAQTLGGRQLAGQRIRERMAAMSTGTDGSDTLDRRARGGGGSKLKPGAGTGGGTKGARFDSAGYLAGLARQTAEGLDKVNLIEEEALRKNAAMLAEGKISRETAAKAVTLIEANAVFERRELLLAEAEERRALIEKQGLDEIAQAKRLAAEQAKGQQFAQELAIKGDPSAQAQLQFETEVARLQAAYEIDRENYALYAAAKLAARQQLEQALAAINQREIDRQMASQSQVLQSYGSLFGSLAEVTRGFAGEQSGAYKAMFAVSKAFAIADSIVKIQQGIASSLSLPFPANIAAAASTAAAASGLISTIQGTNFGGGRQYGGPASAGTMYRVNEGGRPEMFTAANGAQYMMPTADGRVTPTGGGSGGQVLELRIINQHSGAAVSQRTGSDGRPEVVIAEVAAQISERRGPVYAALRSSTNVQPRL